MKGWEIVAMATILVDSNDSMMFQMDLLGVRTQKQGDGFAMDADSRTR